MAVLKEWSSQIVTRSYAAIFTPGANRPDSTFQPARISRNPFKLFGSGFLYPPNHRLLVCHVRARTNRIIDNGRLIFGYDLEFWKVVCILMGPPELFTVQCPVGTWLKSDWAKYSSLPWASAPPCQLGGKTTKRFQCDSLASRWPHLPTCWHFPRLVLVSCE